MLSCSVFAYDGILFREDWFEGAPEAGGIWEEAMESRVEKAVGLFESGFNCAQSVFGAYAELFGMDMETALKLSCPMGGGMGRMREVCGTVSAMSMLSGLKEGNTDPENEAAKKAAYELVRRMASDFRQENGSIVCRELLGIDGMETSAAPSVRTRQYYASRPCTELVRSAARIVERYLLDGTQA